MTLQQTEMGFTLIESMVVLAVMTTLLGLAAPTMSEEMGASKLTHTSNSFLSNLYLARSEAIKRNARVVLCKSASGLSCATDGGWEQGWIVFHDANNNAALDTGEAILLKEHALPSDFRLTGNDHVDDYISYNAMGATRLSSGALQMGTLVLCRTSTSAGAARQIIVSSTGRPRIQRATASSCT